MRNRQTDADEDAEPRVTFEGTGPAVDLLPGHPVISQFDVTCPDWNGYSFRVEVKLNEDSRQFEAEAVTVERRPGGPPVTTEALRDMAVGRFIAQGVAQDLSMMRPGPDGSVIMNGASAGEFPRTGYGVLSVAEAHRMRDTGPTADTLRGVAEVYMVAHAIGQQPTKAVRESFGISQSTAGAWVGRARSAGLLPPVTS